MLGTHRNYLIFILLYLTTISGGFQWAADDFDYDAADEKEHYDYNYDDYYDSDLHSKSFAMSVIVPSGAQNCYFLEFEPGNKFNFEFTVTETSSAEIGFGGISSPLVDCIVTDGAGHKVIEYWGQSTGKLDRHKVQSKSDYKICYTNRFHGLDDVVVYTDFMITGIQDTQAKPLKKTADDLKEMAEAKVDNSTREVSKTIKKVSYILLNSERKLLAINAQKTFDIFRANAIKGMIDMWSIIHVALIIACSLGQVYAFRYLFSGSTGSQKTKNRA